MKRVIGIVSERPTDQMAIRTVIDRLTGEKNIYRYIQPEQDARGELREVNSGTDGRRLCDMLLLQQIADIAVTQRFVKLF